MSEPSGPDPAAPDQPHPDPYVALLPHRPPFRFIDAVDEIEPSVRSVSRWRITGDEYFLAGHFPGNPIVPGVIQLEALAQAGALTVLADPQYAGVLPLFGGVDKVRWRRLVRPGDEVRLDLVIERMSARGGWSNGRATVDGELCCEARMLVAIGRP